MALFFGQIVDPIDPRHVPREGAGSSGTGRGA